jgi:hypothetical protein
MRWFEVDDSVPDDTTEQKVACQPQNLYYLDYNGIPQISDEGIAIVN